MIKEWNIEDFDNCYKERVPKFEDGFSHAQKQGIPRFIEKYRLSRIKDVIALFIVKSCQKKGKKALVLDLGCGHGWFAFRLKDKWGFKGQIIGVDVSRHNIEIFNQEIELRDDSQSFVANVANCEMLPFDDNLFDTIYATESIEHIKNPQKAFLEAYRVLKNGGEFFITTPSKALHNFWRGVFYIPKLLKRLCCQSSNKDRIEVYDKPLSLKDIKNCYTNAGFKLTSSRKALFLPHESYIQFFPKFLQHILLIVAKLLEKLEPISSFLGLHHIIIVKAEKVSIHDSIQPS